MGVKRLFRRFLITTFLLLFIPVGIGFIMLKLGAFNVKHIDVEGNKQFSSVELSNHVLSDKRCRYTPYLLFKYKFFKPKAMPFVSDIDVSLTSLTDVKIRVVEKPIVAYVEHLGSHLFIDSDGIVVESSDRKVDGILKIDGIKCKTFKLYERLKIENPLVLDTINTVSKQLNKYNLNPDVMVVDLRGGINLKFEELTVHLGDEDNMEAKIARLSAILPKLKKKKGVLKLNNYREPGDSIVYRA